MTPLEIIFTLTVSIFVIGFTAFAIISHHEKHKRAARLSLLFAAFALCLLVFFLISTALIQNIVTGILAAALLVCIILLLWPVGDDIPHSPMPTQRVDERTIMFARATLQPGTPEFEAYYAAHPEHKAPDDAFRQNPGLLAPNAAFYHPLPGSSSEGSFFLTEALREVVDGPVSPIKTTRSPEGMTRFIKHLAIYYGTYDIGVCNLQPYHIYTNIGRGTGEYGAPITLNHQFAIAFTVEMAHEMVNAGPRMATVMESAQQYAEAGKIAVILAATIRNLGYPARAHIDGNYRVIAPLVAKDAGLGEIGRMGLLITPKLGPRVRLGVVTTDLPLVPDTPTWDPTMIDFCINCNKCAAVCPSEAIPFGERKTYSDGTLRWKIDPERCYTYWTKVGTDCGRCMAVCPYAHADNFMHNMIRFGVRHSNNFRHAAVFMDDLFYGKKPIPHSPPDWLGPPTNNLSN
ncbi:MAG: 4Fe-4S dicluster domain-containing protein [Chloroflexota bacterium]|nr:4Fe-4S dicluster domain-containing protein [Chloroflexota bacterium]